MSKSVPHQENEKSPKLSSLVRSLLREKGLTVKLLASKTNLKEASIRNSIQRNKYSLEQLKIILEAIDMDVEMEDIEQESVTIKRLDTKIVYCVGWLDQARSDTYESFYGDDKFIATVEDIRKGKIKFNDAIRCLFAQMGKGDKFYYMSFTELPLEIDPSTIYSIRKELRIIIAKAALNGAEFTYIFPSNKAIQKAKIPYINSDKYWKNPFEVFNNEIKLTKENFSNSTEIDNIESVKVIPTNDTRFLMPFHKIAFYQHNERIFSFSVCDSDSDDPAHSPLKSNATSIIKDFIDSVDKQ
jgi:predicted transcriptional regulator